ncbi:hypothetical protein [Treponema pedis]|uniref:Uncharacterized protein n=1 Tax=Treponema pedis str. T A4 TaxID=1291379 RepID=S5ZLB8_9SPIR|nr:hypothetical protein [Treponema pedis]AGT43372.1 hypothetical protein TPE_0876 [Treponema pedis str. T A4]QSI04188.1 hypothetical protein DYQ05_04195 [Treponema pedis]
MRKKKDLIDYASDFLEKHWSAYAEVCDQERREKEEKAKEICKTLRKQALNLCYKYKDENGQNLPFIKSIGKRIKILKATKKK